MTVPASEPLTYDKVCRIPADGVWEASRVGIGHIVPAMAAKKAPIHTRICREARLRTTGKESSIMISWFAMLIGSLKCERIGCLLSVLLNDRS